MKKRCALLWSLLLLFCLGIGPMAAAAETAIAFSVPRRSLDIGETVSFQKLLKTGKAAGWTSSDRSVVTVNAGGVATGVKRGTATIKATDASGNSASCTVTVGYYAGVDVSRWQGDIDWNTLKQQGIDFAMIRSSFGWYDDKNEPVDFQFDAKFKRNVSEAKRVGMPFGLYHYSYATTVNEAHQEASYVLDALNWAGLKPADVKLPIALDMEEISLMSQIGKQTAAKIVIAFRDDLKKAGYQAILYTSKNHFSDYFDVTALNNAGIKFWMAWYADKPNLTNPPAIGSDHPIMWQYTDEGYVSGISGNVDQNVLYMSSDIRLHTWEEAPGPLAPDSGKGDLDQDGYITVTDALMALQTVAGKLNLSENLQVSVEVSGDGQRNVFDALLILKYATRAITAF